MSEEDLTKLIALFTDFEEELLEKAGDMREAITLYLEQGIIPEHVNNWSEREYNG